MADIHFVCCSCGKHLAIDEQGVGQTIKCPDCGMAVTVPNADIKWNCSKCGSRLLAQVSLSGQKITCLSCNEDEWVPEMTVKKAIPFLHLPVEKTVEELRKCPCCEAELKMDEVMCPRCGMNQRMGRMSRETPLLRDATPPTPNPRCPNCGTEVGSDDILCVKCGTNLKTGRKIGKGVYRQPSQPSKPSGNGGLRVAAIVILVVGGAAWFGSKKLHSTDTQATPSVSSLATSQSQPAEPKVLFAVLDETVEQVERKLGTHRVSRSEGEKSIRFYKHPGGGLNHQITFIDGKAVSIQYGRDDEQPLTPEQIRSFLEANGQTWVEAEKGRMWVRDKQDVTGEWLPNQRYLFSVVYMKVAEDAVRRLRTAVTPPQEPTTDAKSVYETGFKLARGSGGVQDDRKAFDLISRAADQGYLPAQHDLAVMYNIGQGCRRDPQKSTEWFTKAASQGELASQLALGWMLVFGQGVAKNPRAGFGWYKQAYEQGSMDAAFALGSLYEDGIGTAQDKRMTAKLYLEAAEKGHVEAQKAVAKLYYENGYEDKSIYWYRMAASQGDDFAKLAVKTYESDKSAPVLINCRTCSGAGRLPISCPDCKGRGRLESKYKLQCAGCLAYINPQYYRTAWKCARCGSSNQKYIKEAQCRTCNGKGRVNSDCEKCKGTGTVSTPGKARLDFQKSNQGYSGNGTQYSGRKVVRSYSSFEEAYKARKEKLAAAQGGVDAMKEALFNSGQTGGVILPRSVTYSIEYDKDNKFWNLIANP